MNDLIPIKCVMMRGGTSRGAFFLASDLPANTQARDKALLSIMGSGHPLQIDGIGGGNPVTSKVAIISPASVVGADVDYLFAQIRNDKAIVDLSANCGNMLAAVGPFAIEAGLVRPSSPQTLVRIHNVNTGQRIEAEVPVQDNKVCYQGDSAIDGVPGTGAPIYLTFFDSVNGHHSNHNLFPTSSPLDKIDGMDVTCINGAMPMVLMAAADLGLSGYETVEALNQDKPLLQKMEHIRLEAGKIMGFGDVRDKVVPKPVLLSQGERGATLTARYFMPQSCHPSLATTGAVGIATACTEPGTLAARIAGCKPVPGDIVIAHPSGKILVSIRLRHSEGKTNRMVSISRTARRLFEGFAFARPDYFYPVQ